MPRGPGDRIGRYVIDRRLGVGGMAEAYLAHQEGPAGFSKSVVVKALHSQHAHEPAMVEMFLREARLGARLNHQNLVQIFDLGEVDGQFYIAMEYVDGLTLLQLTKRCWGLGQGIPMEIAVRVVAAAAAGLHHAHTLKASDGSDAGVIHRDISPDNIIIARDGAVKVLDFGVAKLRGSEGTQSGEIKGKIPFMSPEQLNPQGDVDARTDLWALGVTLYWCLCGQRPFGGPSDIHTVRAILELEPVPVRELNQAVPQVLEDVVMNLLEKDRDKRIASAAKLAARLHRLVPAAQHNPVARFMERMGHFDDDPPEAKAKTQTTTPGTGGLPAAPLASDSTDVLLRDATAQAHLAEASADRALAPTSRTEDVPSTVRLVPGEVRRASRSWAPLVLAVAALGAIIVTAVVVMRPTAAPTLDARGGGEVPAPTPPAPTPAAPEVPEVSPPPLPAQPEPAVEQLKAGPARAARSVAVVAPPQVRWLTSSGKTLGQGTRTLAVTEDIIVAYDTKRDGRTQVPVAARIDYGALPSGKLVVRVLPYATDVKLGTETLGPTPVRTISLTAGTYRVVIEKEGQRVTRTVKVKANDETLVTVDMRTAK